MAKTRRRYVPQVCSVLPHELDHIRAQKHHGQSTLQNLCLACAFCNAFKGTNVAGNVQIGASVSSVDEILRG